MLLKHLYVQNSQETEYIILIVKVKIHCSKNERLLLKECHPCCVYQNYSRSMIKEYLLTYLLHVAESFLRS